jgi:hypothetical protein
MRRRESPSFIFPIGFNSYEIPSFFLCFKGPHEASSFIFPGSYGVNTERNCWLMESTSDNELLNFITYGRTEAHLSGRSGHHRPEQRDHTEVLENQSKAAITDISHQMTREPAYDGMEPLRTWGSCNQRAGDDPVPGYRQPLICTFVIKSHGPENMQFKENQCVVTSLVYQI